MLAGWTLSRTQLGFSEGQTQNDTGKRLIEGDPVQDKGGSRTRQGSVQRDGKKEASDHSADLVRGVRGPTEQACLVTLLPFNPKRCIFGMT